MNQVSQPNVINAAKAGVDFLYLNTTVVPGHARHQLAVLEAVLRGIATGQLVVDTPPANPVESVGVDPTAEST